MRVVYVNSLHHTLNITMNKPLEYLANNKNAREK